ncbi:MAG: glutamine synthetase type III, partial [Treponema sp.]|nr:glutamine synthetase type III [Treponema sp.]
SQFADHLEKSKDFTADLAALVKKTFSKHKRIIFNGNNYSEEWIEDAKKRGLSNLKTAVDALPEFISKKSIELFTKHHVFSETEIHSRYEILMDAYCKTLHIEALTMIDMVKSYIVPSSVSYQRELIDLLRQKKAYGIFNISMENHWLENITRLSTNLLNKLIILENAVLESSKQKFVELRTIEDSNLRLAEILKAAYFYRDKILTAMSELRIVVDELETLTAKKHWPFPSYAEILYSVI